MTEEKAPYWTWPKVLIASVLLPPVGIAAWWLRPWSRGWFGRTMNLIGRVAVSFFLVGLTLFYLVKLGILHAELSGAGWQPIFSFHNPAADLQALETHRAAQKAKTSAAAPAPAAIAGSAWPEFRGPNRSG